MKLKHFLLTVLFLCSVWKPAPAENVSLSGSATGGLADAMFTFDPRLSSIKLEYVDFKIPRGRTASEWGKEIGRYNFKLFGCRRNAKKLILNEGRAMRRDMRFQDVFFEEMNELFPVVVDKNSPYFPYSVGDRIPGYLITAEIKDLYVNVCDQYDWRTRSYPRLRNGTAEIKVLWRVMTPFNRKLYWEDSTYGYADIQDPIRNGEVRLVEKAFADALVRMIGAPGFMDVMRNIPSESDINAARADYERMAYDHIQNRRNLMTSYRRKRMKFYHERERERVLDTLDRLGQKREMLASNLRKARKKKPLTEEEKRRFIQNQIGLAEQIAKNAQALDELAPSGDNAAREIADLVARAKYLASKDNLTPEEQAELEELLEKIGKMAQNMGLSDALLADIAALRNANNDWEEIDEGEDQDDSREIGSAGLQRLCVPEATKTVDTVDASASPERNITDDEKPLESFFGRLLKSNPQFKGMFGRLLKNAPLLRLLDGATGGDVIPFEDPDAYGFSVSENDGYITINNQKPFRYLSPNRIYRIRASVVAVVNDKNVGSGIVIAPSLVLTNYSIVKQSPYTKVEFLDGRVKSAMVLRADETKDVALLFIPPETFSDYTWPVPIRLDLPEVGEEFYAVGTPMRGGYEGAMETGKVVGYRYGSQGVDVLTNTNVQSITLGGLLVDGNGNAMGLAHAGLSPKGSRDGFIPLGDAFEALKIRIRDRDTSETPTQKALRLKKERETNYIK